MQYYDMGAAGDHTRWTFSRLRFVSCLLKDKLKSDGIWEDFVQELHGAAYLAWQHDMSMPETRRYARRRIHAFLKQYGYKSYRNGYTKAEQCFSAVFPDWQVNNLATPDIPASRFGWEDTAGDNHIKEHIVSLLKRKLKGMTRTDLCPYLGTPVKEIQAHLDSLLREKRIVQVKREGYGGYPPTPLYFIADAKIPEQHQVKTETYERIRRLYSEGKTTRQIAQEGHHSLRTIHMAIHSAPAPVAAGKRELAAV
jgi:hypothetical protein